MKGVWTILLCPACGTRPASVAVASLGLLAFRGSRSCPIGPIEPLQGALSGCLAPQRVGLFSVGDVAIAVADADDAVSEQRAVRAEHHRPRQPPLPPGSVQ